MHHILVYADSLSWGIIPNTRNRLSFEERWPGVFENQLKENGLDVRVIENCLNGRRTAWSDPFKKGRDGSAGLAEVIEMHSPLELVVLMLGTNDFQSTHDIDARLSAQGVAKLVQIIRSAPLEPGMEIPSIMIVSPPIIVEPKGAIAFKLRGAEKRCAGLPKALEMVADELSTLYFDSNTVTSASRIDGIHLDKDQHLVLGRAIANLVTESKIF